MTTGIAALVLGLLLGAGMAGTIFRGAPPRFTVKLIRNTQHAGAPVVLVELPDHYDRDDVDLAKLLAREVTNVLADAYGWPLPAGVAATSDPALVDDVDLHNPAQVIRAIDAHRSGRATFAIPHDEWGRDGARLTWHPGETKAPPATKVRVIVAPTDTIGAERMAELRLPSSARSRTVVVTIEDAFRHAAAEYRPGELDIIPGAHPDVIAYMRSRIRIPRDRS